MNTPTSILISPIPPMSPVSNPVSPTRESFNPPAITLIRNLSSPDLYHLQRTELPASPSTALPRRKRDVDSNHHHKRTNSTADMTKLFQIDSEPPLPDIPPNFSYLIKSSSESLLTPIPTLTSSKIKFISGFSSLDEEDSDSDSSETTKFNQSNVSLGNQLRSLTTTAPPRLERSQSLTSLKSSDSQKPILIRQRQVRFVESKEPSNDFFLNKNLSASSISSKNSGSDSSESIGCKSPMPEGSSKNPFRKMFGKMSKQKQSPIVSNPKPENYAPTLPPRKLKIMLEEDTDLDDLDVLLNLTSNKWPAIDRTGEPKHENNSGIFLGMPLL
ncbi:hypothetical protein HK096_005011 [Nowakowskiella sp. JEL0078]|nr:hypothetical protein HK096_005011 [Nowakowskiella sp. JEL0078]